MANNKTIRVVTRSADGELKAIDHDSLDNLQKHYEQIGIDDCSTDLSLRGMPVFRGLVGPIPESKSVCRYETADVFESLTKEWSKTKTKRRRRRSSASVPTPNMVANEFGVAGASVEPA